MDAGQSREPAKPHILSHTHVAEVHTEVMAVMKETKTEEKNVGKNQKTTFNHRNKSFVYFSLPFSLCFALLCFVSWFRFLLCFVVNSKQQAAASMPFNSLYTPLHIHTRTHMLNMHTHAQSCLQTHSHVNDAYQHASSCTFDFQLSFSFTYHECIYQQARQFFAF